VSVRRLEVWLDHQHVASIDAKQPWALKARYTAEVVESLPGNSPLLSCSLPVTRQWQDASWWARGLLPEGAHLLALATRAKVPTNYTSDLLARYGRDIAGAFTLTAGPPPDARRWAVEEYTGDQLADELRNSATEPGFATRDDSELSLAGLQNKILVVHLGPARWGRPVNGHPSTHIMKLDDPQRPGLIEAEHSCLTLANTVGLTTIRPQFTHIDGIPVLIVNRFDRIEGPDGAIGRLHQEDACQALAANLDDGGGRGKYENAGGPSFAAIAQLLEQHATDPAAELAQLLRLAVFTTVIGNSDAHGKNVSFLIDTSAGTISLAPAYDTVPTALWPTLRRTAAMTTNGLHSIVATRDDLIAEAGIWGVGRTRADAIIEAFTDSLEAAVADLPIRPDVAELIGARTRVMLSN